MNTRRYLRIAIEETFATPELFGSLMCGCPRQREAVEASIVSAIRAAQTDTIRYPRNGG
jgi:hypothetical protein